MASSSGLLPRLDGLKMIGKRRLTSPNGRLGHKLVSSGRREDLIKTSKALTNPLVLIEDQTCHISQRFTLPALVSNHYLVPDLCQREEIPSAGRALLAGHLV